MIGCGWNEYGKLDVRTLGGNVEGQARVNDHRESADGDDVKRMRRLGRQVFLEVCRDTVLGHQIRLAKKNGICDSLRGAKQGVVRDAADRFHIAGSKIDLSHELEVLR